MALVAGAFPALVVAGLRSADAGAEEIVMIGSFAAAAAALALAGAMTAFIGKRLRSTLPGIVATALLVAPPFGVVAILHLAAIFVAPLLLAPLGLAPVAAGAGDGAGLAACRRALALCGGGGYRRSLVPCAITASFAAVALPGLRNRALTARRPRPRDRDADPLGGRRVADRGPHAALALRRALGPPRRAAPAE